MVNKSRPTLQEKNRLCLWRHTLIILFMRIKVLKNLAPQSEKLFEELPDDPATLDYKGLQHALDSHLPLVCVEETCILSYYSIFDDSNKGGNNISKNGTQYIKAVRKKIQEIINSSEEFKELHKKIKVLRNGVIAHHSGEFFRANREARNDEEYVFLNLNRLTTFLLNKSEFETLELLCSKIYNYIRFDDPLQI